MLCSCIDAGITSQLFDCDHCVLFLKLGVLKRLKRKTGPCQHGPRKLDQANSDHQKLSNPEIRKNLCEEVIRNINGNSDVSYSDVFNAT